MPRKKSVPTPPPKPAHAAKAPPPARLHALPSTAPGRASLTGPKSGVVVVGSMNMDLMMRTDAIPTPGETVMGQDLIQNPGGKGANQATAVGKLWTKRTPGAKLIARIGDDVYGDNMLAALHKNKVDTTSILKTRHVSSGTAMIVVDRHGENAIVVAAGANRHLSASDLLAQRKTIEASTILIAQLEIPHDTAACAFALAKRSNVLTILDPAPAPPEGLPESLYHVDILTPNQSEAYLMAGMHVRTVEEARRAAERFLIRGSRIVVMKMGSSGAVIVQTDERGQIVAQHITGYRIPVTDTTAAGDAFTGAMAVGLAEGMPLPAAVKFANAAGALTCMKSGAVTSIPNRAEVEAFIVERQ
jgi:ribokinase